ncbi:MAG: PEP-CTERM system TPR-repeat protein PrsT [Burkholderiales bacterium]|nr:PEP-CTERM system TPR-repeat protein PrsT [Burkholderiales bacterium]
MAIFGPKNHPDSKGSPSDLLAGPANVPARGSDGPDVCRVSPSSLLGDEPPPDFQRKAERVGALVSPETLLAPSAPPSTGRKRYLLAGGLIALVLALGGVFLGQKQQRPIAELMQEARAYHTRGDNASAAILLKNIVSRDAQNAEAHLLLGKAYIAVGAILDAQGALQRAEDLGVSPVETVPLAVQVLIDLDRHEEALKVLGDAKLLVGKVPSGTIALLLGRAYLGAGNTVEARTQFSIARSESPGPAMAGLARVLMAEGDTDRARKLLAEATATHANTVEAWLAKGDLLRGEDKPKEAMAAYRVAESLAPGSLEAILSSAITLISQDDLVEARKELRKARAIAPSSHLLGFANAVLALQEKRYDDCRDLLQSVLSTVPRHMPSVYLAGMLSLSVGHLEQAQDAFTAYLTKFPGNIQARKMLAIVLLRKQRAQAAVEIVAPLAELDVKDPGFLLVAGEAYLQTGNAERARALLDKAARLDSSNPSILTSLGAAQLASGAGDSAIAEFQKAVALQPKDPLPYRRLATTLMAKGRIDEALAVADKLERSLPKSPEPHWLRGLAYSLRKDSARARASHEAALKLDPGYFPAAAKLAEQAVASGNANEARARLEAVLKASAGHLEASLALARLDGAEGKVARALSRVQAAVDDHPQSTAAKLLLAEMQRRSGQIDAALATARRAREADLLNPGAAELLGRLQLETKDIDGAAQTFTSLVNMRPRYLPGRLQLADVQNASGQRRAAIVTLQEALALGPGGPRTYSLLAALLLQEKQYSEAFAVAEQAKKQLPGRSLGILLEGEIRLAQGDLKQALLAFRRGKQIEPTAELEIRLHQAESKVLDREAPLDAILDWVKTHPKDALVQFYAADALVRAGRSAEAIPLYLALLERAPGDYRLLNNLADALVRQGDPRALDYAQQALQVRPKDPVIAATLGAALLSQGKLVEAMQVLQNAVRLDPDNAEIRFQFVMALVKAGDRARAKAELHALLAAGKSFPQIAEARGLAAKL